MTEEFLWTPRLSRALELGHYWHRDQRRKYTLEPYMVHPIRVMEIVRTVPHNEDMLIAALLHDAVEDTEADFDDISNEFGERVRMLVFYLTDVSKKTDGNRKLRKSIDRAHSAQGPAEAQTIKLADLIDNAYDITKHDKDFAVVYMREKALLLDVLTRGDRELHRQASDLVVAFNDMVYGEPFPKCLKQSSPSPSGDGSSSSAQ